MHHATAATGIDVQRPWRDPKKGTVMTHLEWAIDLGGCVAGAKGFRGAQEQSELEAVAALTLWRKALKFDHAMVPAGGDPDGQFRGWAHQSIVAECEREAKRLRTGGTMRTPNTTGENAARVGRVRVEGLPTRTNEYDGREECVIPDAERDEPDLDEPWSPYEWTRVVDTSV